MPVPLYKLIESGDRRLQNDKEAAAACWSTEEDLDADGEEQDGDEREVDDGVDDYGDAAGLEAAELHDPALAGDLEQQPRREEDEEHQPHEHRGPVRHVLATYLLSDRYS
ncbi:hypothetical protein D1007_02478 [Hordeum vulgare]|nr:hypothetical protein D1007_02478 [Hordeum vulgare]